MILADKICMLRKKNGWSQEGDYSLQKKKRSPILKAVLGAYWLVVVAVYLAYSFMTWDWRSTWVI